jgi:hypothetical protein
LTRPIAGEAITGDGNLFYKILSTVYLFKNMQKNIVKLTFIIPKKEK